MNRRYRHSFLLLCAACVIATTLYGIRAALRTQAAATSINSTQEALRPGTTDASKEHSDSRPAAISTPPAKEQTRSDAAAAPRVAVNTLHSRSNEPAPSQRNRLFFRTTELGGNYGKLTEAGIEDLDNRRFSGELSCDRLHFSNGSGVCLVSDRGVFTKFYAVGFDETLRRRWTISLDGFPSRVRLSRSGDLAAITVFLVGHSYASLNFSTRTTIIDAHNGTVLADLDEFHVVRDSAPFQSPDFNFWGVTFARDQNRFYATLWSKGKTYLIECNLKKRSAAVIYEGVECPSLSPDNQSIAFKKRTGPGAWVIAILDLQTLITKTLAVRRSVDDQVEWLDNGHILYALSADASGASASTDIWEISTEGAHPPRVFLRSAYSPAVVSARN